MIKNYECENCHENLTPEKDYNIDIKGLKCWKCGEAILDIFSYDSNSLYYRSEMTGNVIADGVHPKQVVIDTHTAQVEIIGASDYFAKSYSDMIDDYVSTMRDIDISEELYRLSKLLDLDESEVEVGTPKYYANLKLRNCNTTDSNLHDFGYRNVQREEITKRRYDLIPSLK